MERRRKIEEEMKQREEEREIMEQQQQSYEQDKEESEVYLRNLDILEADEISPTSPNSRLSYTSQQLLNIRNYIHSINTKYNELEVFIETDNEDDDLVSFEYLELHLVRNVATLFIFYLLIVCVKNELYMGVLFILFNSVYSTRNRRQYGIFKNCIC